MNLTIGIVKANYDIDHPGMVQVTIEDFGANGAKAVWMPAASLYAGKDYGFYLLPEKDDQVIVGFLNGDPNCGVVLGSLGNKRNTVPTDTASNENNVYSLITKGGHKIDIFDTDKKITSDNNSVMNKRG